MRLRAQVLYYDGGRGHFFVQDQTAGINVELSTWPELKTGDVVEIEGVTDPGHFAPRIAADTVRVVGREPLPPPRKVHVERMLTGLEDSQWVEIEGIVRAVYPLAFYPRAPGRLFVDIVSAGVRIPLYFPNTWEGPLPTHLVDARVRIAAVGGSQFNASRQLNGVLLYVPSAAHVGVEAPAPPASALPVQHIGDLFRFTTVAGAEHRIRVRGVVTSVKDRQFSASDDTGGVTAIFGGQLRELNIGDRVEVIGFPETGADTPLLRDVTVMTATRGRPPVPLETTPAAIMAGGMDSRFVRLSGTLIKDVRTREHRILLLESAGVFFTAELPSGTAGRIPSGSQVRVSGICNVVTDERDSPRVPRSFKLVLRSVDDAAVVAAPLWWTLQRALWVVGGLGLTILAAFAWVAILRRRVREQTAVIRERLEEEIALQARYRELFENANDVICTYTAGGEIVSVNRAAERVTGYSREEALRRNVRDLIVPEHRGRLEDMLSETVRTGESTTFEVDLIARDGGRVTLELDTRRTTIAGGRIGVQAIGRDITERKRTEQVLRQARDEAEAASRAKSEFVANMSHELRTPLNGILGMTGLLLNTDLNDEQSAQLRMVKLSAEALEHVTNDVLDFSRLEAGRLTLRPQSIDLRECLTDTLQGLAAAARDSELELTCRIARHVPRIVLADPDRLRQVLQNLAANAVKFTHAGGVIVDVEASATDEASQEWLITISVTDTGIGIPADKRKAIFDAFTQVDGSLTRRYGGTGLGLAIASSLVRLMGGTIGVESEVGRGSTFSVALPMVGRPGPHEVDSLPRATCLVVERHDATREVLCRQLAAWGLTPAPAAGVERALAFLRTPSGRECRLAIADAATVRGELARLVAALHDSAPAARLIGCALAARADEAAEARRCGAVAFLPKPLRDGDLLRACQAALRSPSASHVTNQGASVPDRVESGRAVVLLVEDNVINQRVAEQILKRRGHDVRIAHNGRQAVEILERWTPDLVFMDVQMPEMNGIDATRAIRAREAKRGGHVPIVALTAHAMPADREQCLRAGMDDFLTKPVSPTALTQTVERIVEQRTNDTNAGGAGTGQAGSAEGILDPAVALERVDGDRELLGEIIELFFQDIGALVQDLEQAVRAQDAEAIMRTAHRLKGSVATFAAKPATEAALRLETMGRSGDITEAAAALSHLQVELARLEPALQSLRMAS